MKRNIRQLDKKDDQLYLGNYQSVVDQTMEKMRKEKIVNRIWQHDHTVWKQNPSEITNRLGWLHSPLQMKGNINEIRNLVNSVRKEGFTHVLLLGMGGSSLAPEVFSKIFGIKNRFLDLQVLDSTDPETILWYTNNLKLEKTLFLVSTKSGSTVETISLMKYFYNLVLKRIGKEKVGNHFVTITDPDSSLVELSKKLKFRKIFLNDPNVGGRYSALTYFGLVPAALIGVDLELLLNRALTMVSNTEASNSLGNGNDSSYWLGVSMGTLALLGLDKLTFISSVKLKHFSIWLEQLIAESTGKEGKGILPVEGETELSPQYYANDRLFVYLCLADDNEYDITIQKLIDNDFPVIYLNLKDIYDLGGEYFRWEMATAITGWVLNINPFDQPNVESAKILARNMVKTYQEEGELPELQPTLQSDDITVYTDNNVQNLSDVLPKFLNSAFVSPQERSYVAIQAYLTPTKEIDQSLQKFRTAIQKRYKLASTIGYGPRFLHSTGQLHKGDAGRGLFIQLTSDNARDIDIPEKTGEDASFITFGILKKAQSLGDRQALLDAKRKVLRIHLGKHILRNIDKIAKTIE
jgi:glucose-6-phosphate isomerase